MCVCVGGAAALAPRVPSPVPAASAQLFETEPGDKKVLSPGEFLGSLCWITWLYAEGKWGLLASYCLL